MQKQVEVPRDPEISEKTGRYIRGSDVAFPMDDEDWQQVTADITSLSLALETFEEGDAQQQGMLLEIMMRCAQRVAIQLEDLNGVRNSR